MTDALGATLQTSDYNIRGMRTASSDVDRGNWTFAPNALGELVSVTDAKGQQTQFTYDFQSRPRTRTMPEGAGSIVSTWTWGQSSATKNVGKLEWMEIGGTGLTTFRETYSYNEPAGRLIETQYTEGSTNYFVNYAYSASTGFLEQITYPVSTSGFRFKARYDYQHGYPSRVWNYDTGDDFWVADDVDARGNLAEVTLGDAGSGTTFTTLSTYDKVTGLLQARQSTFASGTPIENLSFLWDRVGNLTQRQDNRQGLSENFYYDNLHRLDYSTLGAVTTQYDYDARGNLTSKTGVGTYSYTATAPGCSYAGLSPQIHAVRQITGSSTLNFCYDANGNMTNRNGTAITWFASNLPKSITKDANNSSAFQYTPDGRRWRQVYRTGGASYTHTYLGNLVEKVVAPTSTDWKHHVFVNGASIALYIRKSTGAEERYFFTKDHLNGMAAFSSSNGSSVVHESFEAFGARRGSSWTGTPSAGELSTMNNVTRRGFTFHEHLDSTSLIHMNGRVFDPVIARFLSSDPLIDGRSQTQGWNRFAYVKNNPLSRWDPSGFTTVTVTAKKLNENAPGGAAFPGRTASSGGVLGVRGTSTGPATGSGVGRGGSSPVDPTEPVDANHANSPKLPNGPSNETAIDVVLASTVLSMTGGTAIALAHISAHGLLGLAAIETLVAGAVLGGMAGVLVAGMVLGAVAIVYYYD